MSNSAETNAPGDALVDAMVSEMNALPDDDFAASVLATGLAMLVGLAAEMTPANRQKMAATVSACILSGTTDLMQ